MGPVEDGEVELICVCCFTSIELVNTRLRDAEERRGLLGE